MSAYLALVASIVAGSKLTVRCNVGIPGAAGPPTLTLVATSGGAVGDIAGGYTATLTGTNFTGATGVTFGGTAATALVVVGPTSITCTVPAHATGAVSVVVTTPSGSNAANTLFRFFSPAELPLSLWNRGDFAVPWTANASTGASLANGSLVTAGSDPTAGTSYNGHVSANFASASSQYLTNPTDAAVLYGTSAKTIVALLAAGGAVAPTGNVYDDAAIVVDANADTGMSYTTSGYTMFVYDGAYKSKSVPMSGSALHLVMGRHDGANLGMTLDSAAEVTQAAGNSAVMTGTLYVGRGYLGAKFFDGKIEELMIASAVLTPSNYADIKSYCNTRYNLTL